VLAHLSELVVKEVQGSGGYGMLVRPDQHQGRNRGLPAADTRRNRTISSAQPTLALSSCPTLVEAGVAPRHVDLRPFVLSGKEIRLVFQAGLTRVALKEGSLGGQSIAGRRHQGYLGTGGIDDVIDELLTICYWMARHIERAENTARILDVAHRSSLLPLDIEGARLTSGMPRSISPAARPGMNPGSVWRSADTVTYYMALDQDNPSSIYSCLKIARENARCVRSAITSEMWEVINSTWLELEKMPRELDPERCTAFFDRVKERSHLFRGVTLGTIIKDMALNFIRLGTFLERADNTARILDVKYHILLPSVSDVGGAADYYHWGSLLKSVSALEAYRNIYHDVISPQRVAELLIFSEDMPRSLHSLHE
jgi:uncharacterized alpha-E superfamily protein